MYLLPKKTLFALLGEKYPVYYVLLLQFRFLSLKVSFESGTERFIFSTKKLYSL